MASVNMVIRPDVELTNLSDVGCVRETNQDDFAYFEPQSEAEFARRGRLLVVADGMGGHKGGEVASSIAAETMRQVFLNSEGEEPLEVLVEGFTRAHQAIVEEMSRDPELEGMGTTCSAAILRDGRLAYGHVGDSRIYLVRDGIAAAITEDHTMVNRLLRAGSITAEEARNHPQKNVLTAALGGNFTVTSGEFSVLPQPLGAGDVVLLCSDGLHGLVNDEELGILAQSESLEEGCRQMVQLARQRGGPDNITVQMLRMKGAAA